MINRLFVYGTLAPGQSNEHILFPINGTWQPARVRGKLFENGWGPALGYPAVVLDESAGEVEGQIFSSGELADHWARLDEFEGEGYRRETTLASVEDGRDVEVQVYVLNV